MKGAASTILMTLLVLGAISVAAPVIYAFFGLSLVLSAVFYPREMMAFGALLIVASLAANHGLAMLGFLALLAILKIIRECRA